MAVHKLDRQYAGVRVDTSEVKQLIRDLKRAAPAARSGIRRAVKESAAIVAEEARHIAGEHSRSIPPTIKASAYLSGSRGALATVTAGKGVPLAALYELGNRGRGRNPDSPTFRHPVFERSAEGKLQPTDQWVDQARYPFLKPAADRKAAEVQLAAEAVAKAVADIVAIRGI